MTIAAIEHEVYKCPHCPGYIVVRKQPLYYDADCSDDDIISLEHYTDLPDWLKKETENIVEDITMLTS